MSNEDIIKQFLKDTNVVVNDYEIGVLKKFVQNLKDNGLLISECYIDPC